MKSNLKSILKNVSFSTLSSVLSMLISTIVVLVLPKTLSTQNFGYYQLYSLYIGYVGFFQFGLIDGLYIRYGGYYYEQLDKKRINSVFISLLLSQIFISLILAAISIFIFNGNKMIVLLFTAAELVLANVRGMFTYLLQCTNRIKEGAISNTIGRVTFFLLVIVFCLLKVDSFIAILISDLSGRLVALIYSVIVCRDIVFIKNENSIFNKEEIFANIKVGFFLMLSSIASLLIMGIVRISMENKWGIETFARVSLTISVSNLMVQFINAASLVFFPVLRRKGDAVIDDFYWPIRNILMTLMYCSMLLYYPVSQLLMKWLPQYESGLIYMALLFPICIYEGRMSLLNNTILKVKSKTKLIFIINLISVVVSVLLTYISVFVLENITLSIVSLCISIAFRCVFADFFVCEKRKKEFCLSSVEEALLMTSFVLSSWFIKNAYCICVYALFLLVYFFINRKKIKESIIFAKSMLKG